MRWGITFSVEAGQSVSGLPPPSSIEGRTVQLHNRIFYTYHFQYPPHDKKEWQRVAGIKVQIQELIKGSVFEEYEPNKYSGTLYKVSELGKHFSKFVKFPTPFFEGTPQSILCKHAKRLYYEDKLHIEQLIFVSMWIKEIAPSGEAGRRRKDEGHRQVLKRAYSALFFSEEHCENWDKKLSYVDLKKSRVENAEKTNAIKREKNADKIIRAKKLNEDGLTKVAIAKELNVSRVTIAKWLK